MRKLVAIAAWVILGCEIDAPLRRPTDARVDAVDADAPTDPLDDPFARATVRELPPGEAREERCDGQDNDGDGRVDEGWAYVERGCFGECAPPPPGDTGTRPHLALAAAFDGTRGAVIWREGFVQPDNNIPYVEVAWDGRGFRGRARGFAQWRRVASASPTQPARTGSLVWSDGHALALWGYSAAACARTRQCTTHVGELTDRRGSGDTNLTAILSAHPRGSGLVAGGSRVFMALVGDEEGFDLLERNAQNSFRRFPHGAIGVAAEHIGVVRGALWSPDELAWVYEHVEDGQSPRLMAFWTDLEGGVTSAPVEVAREGHFDPVWTTQVAVHDGALLVTHSIGARGFFLTRYDRARRTRDTTLLDRSGGRHRTAWDGATLHMCYVLPGDGRGNHLEVRRYAASGESLGAPMRAERSWSDCVIAARAGVALVGAATYALGGSGTIVGCACPTGSSP